MRPALRNSLGEAASYPPPWARLDPALEGLPRGNGGTVLVLPPIFHGDGATADFREGLSRLGWNAVGWGRARNLGPFPARLKALEAQSDRLAEAGPVSLVGFSMGGLFARHLAARAPRRVARVVTAGTPLHRPLDSFWLPLSPVARIWGPRAGLDRLAEAVSRPLQVPVTTIYSEIDGIVGWRSCVDRHAAALRIDVPHVRMPYDTRVFRAVAEALGA